MKLLRYGPKGQEKPGLLDAHGTLRDLSGVIPDIAGDDAVAGRPGASSRRSTRRRCRLVAGTPRIGAAVGADAASSSASA